MSLLKYKRFQNNLVFIVYDTSLNIYDVKQKLNFCYNLRLALVKEYKNKLIKSSDVLLLFRLSSIYLVLVCLCTNK